MTGITKTAVTGILLAVAAILTYRIIFPVYTHRYRLTLEVETPSGAKLGSGIIQPELVTQPRILGVRFAAKGRLWTSAMERTLRYYSLSQVTMI
jgi:hypothetical protein